MRSSARFLLFCLALFAGAPAQAADPIQPYILAYSSQGALDAEIGNVREALTGGAFEILGEYSPYAGAHVIAVSTQALRDLAASTPQGGFGAAIHVGLTKVGPQVQVSYLNPPYMAAAYRMGAMPESVARGLAKALGAKQAFGSEKGRTVEDLDGYNYMLGMEYFTDMYELGSFDSHAAAVTSIEKNLAAGVGGAAQVYKLEIPGTDQVLFGVSRADVDDKRANDKHILADTVDQKFTTKTTPYLPYQILVVGKDVRALHMRFRMAVYHPDLTMITFGKLITSPAAIEKLLREIAGAPKDKGFSF